MDETDFVPRRLSLEIRETIRDHNADGQQVALTIQTLQERFGYSGNKCVRALFRAAVIEPSVLLDMTDFLTDLITHEKEQRRSARNYLRAQQNFFHCLEKMFHNRTAPAKRNSSEAMNKLALLACGAAHPSSSSNESGLIPPLFGDDSVSSADDSRIQDAIETLIPVYVRLLPDLYRRGAIEDSIVLRWHKLGCNISKHLSDAESAALTSALDGIAEWFLSVADSDDEEDEEDAIHRLLEVPEHHDSDPESSS